MDIKSQTARLLDALIEGLNQADLWSNDKPSTEALASTAPFACDSMSFENWLQFIFIPKMQTLVDNDLPLPNNIAVLPMAEQMLVIDSANKCVFRVLGEIDQLLSRQFDK